MLFKAGVAMDESVCLHAHTHCTVNHSTLITPRASHSGSPPIM